MEFPGLFCSIQKIKTKTPKSKWQWENWVKVFDKRIYPWINFSLIFCIICCFKLTIHNSLCIAYYHISSHFSSLIHLFWCCSENATTIKVTPLLSELKDLLILEDSFLPSSLTFPKYKKGKKPNCIMLLTEEDGEKYKTLKREN